MTSEAAILRIEALKARYGRIEALHDVSLEVHGGEIVAILGANGAGKTTLISAICGLVDTEGDILFQGASITGVSTWERIRRGIGIVPEGRQIWPHLSVEDNILLGGYTASHEMRVQGLDLVFERFPILRTKAHQHAGMLSGGQQQMLAIGRALMSQPKLLLLDEPSMGLAPILTKEILDSIAQLREEGITTVLVEQNANAALRVCDRAYIIETGRTVFDGTGVDLIADPRVQQSYLGI